MAFIFSLFVDSLFLYYSECVSFIHYLKVVFLSCSSVYPISELKIPSGYCKMEGTINLKVCPCILFKRAWCIVLFVLKTKKRQNFSLRPLQKNKLLMSKQLRKPCATKPCGNRSLSSPLISRAIFSLKK